MVVEVVVGVVWKGTVGRSFFKVDAKEGAGRVSKFFNAGCRGDEYLYE